MSESELPPVQLFTDGACSGNPGPGGWGYILRDPAADGDVKNSGGDRHTTNNRMEMISVIEGLKSLAEPRKVTVVTDSSYVQKGIDQWMAGWKRNGWRRRSGKKWEPVKNVELWQEIDELCQKHEVTCEWIRGHAGHPENEECDRLAVAATQSFL